MLIFAPLLVFAPQFFAREKCEVHELTLRLGAIPMRYGLSERPTQPRWLFPNENPWRASGCAPQVKMFEFGLYCQQCRTAVQNWRDQNPKGVPPQLRRATWENWRAWVKAHPTWSARR